MSTAEQQDPNVVVGTIGTIEPPPPPGKRTRRTRAAPTTLANGQMIEQPASLDLNPSDLISIAVENNLDIEKLEKLLQLQRSWEAEQARKQFFAALSKFQSEIPPIVRESKVDQGRGGKRRFASLGTINECIRPWLYANGLSFRFRQTQGSGGQITVTCIVSHSAGHSEESSITAGADASGAKNPIQSIGSTITYLERYTLVGALGLTTVDGDDDGEGTEAEPAKEPTKEERLEMMRRAAGGGGKDAGKDGQSKDASTEAATTPAPAPAPCTQGQMSELLTRAKDAFPSSEAFKSWVLIRLGHCELEKVSETSMMGVISDVCKIGHERKLEAANAKLAASGTSPTTTIAAPAPAPSPATNEQRQILKDLSMKCKLTTPAIEEYLKSMGVGSHAGLTAEQANERIKCLEAKLTDDEIPF